MPRTLERDEARRFYDRLGALQDSQTWYEEPALERLRAYAALEGARSVVELGCGTGRFAAELLRDHLPPEATLRAYDLSPAMVELAAERLASYGPRTSVERIDGEPPLPLADDVCDRFLTTYVLDLLSGVEVDAWLAEARRLLTPGGRLCVTGITRGPGAVSGVVMGLWSLLHRLSPRLVGGCRPLEVASRLSQRRWQLLHRSVVVARGVASEVLVATPRGG